MELMKLIDVLEETLENAWDIPLVHKSIVNKEELFETINDIRLKIPDDIREAQKITSEKQRIISDAQQEAERILKSAADKVTIMVSEHEVSREANAYAKQIVEEAQIEARNLRNGIKEYVNQRLDEVENTLNSVLSRVREDKNNF